MVHLLFSFCSLRAVSPTPHRAPVTDRDVMESQEAINRTRSFGSGSISARSYIIQKGDTLYSIALSHGIDQKDLAEWNTYTDPGAIILVSNLTYPRLPY